MTYFHEIFKKYAGLLPLRISQFWFGLVLWYLTPLSKIFQLYRGDQFYQWQKPENH